MAITSATSGAAANATTSVITHPASTASGDLIINIVAMDFAAGTSTDNQTFTELKDEGSVDIWAWIAYKKLAGALASVTITHVSERFNAVSYRIPAAEWHGTTVPEITAVADGTSANPDPPSITPSWGAETGTIFIAIDISDDAPAPGPVISYPTNYTLNQVDGTSLTSSGYIASAIRITSAATEDPGAFTLTGSEHWRGYTIAVRGPVLAATVPFRDKYHQLLPH